MTGPSSPEHTEAPKGIRIILVRDQATNIGFPLVLNLKELVAKPVFLPVDKISEDALYLAPDGRCYCRTSDKNAIVASAATRNQGKLPSEKFDFFDLVPPPVKEKVLSSLNPPEILELEDIAVSKEKHL